jgi:hypothetical protein
VALRRSIPRGGVMQDNLTQFTVPPQNPSMRSALELQRNIQHPTDMNAVFSPEGLQGTMARGNNVYLGGLPAAPGAGRPRNPTPNFGDMSSPAMQAALQRQIQSYGTETRAREARG